MIPELRYSSLQKFFIISGMIAAIFVLWIMIGLLKVAWMSL